MILCALPPQSQSQNAYFSLVLFSFCSLRAGAFSEQTEK